MTPARDVGADHRGAVAAIVLAGGRARRFGSDKVRAELAGRPLLAHAIEACRGAGASPIVLVGPADLAAEATLGGDLLVTREDPPFGGPVAAIAAGLPLLHDAQVVLVAAADMPFARAVAPELVATAAGLVGGGNGAGAEGDADGAWAVDHEARHQPLLAAYRVASLTAAVARLDRVEGASMRALTRDLTMASVEAGPAAADIDTPAQLALARGGTS